VCCWIHGSQDNFKTDSTFAHQLSALQCSNGPRGTALQMRAG
jgi:hypothetical protein